MKKNCKDNGCKERNPPYHQTESMALILSVITKMISVFEDKSSWTSDDIATTPSQLLRLLSTEVCFISHRDQHASIGFLTPRSLILKRQVDGVCTIFQLSRSQGSILILKFKDKSNDIKQKLKTVLNFKDTLPQALINKNFLKERQIQRISLTGFPAQSVGSSNTDVLDSPCLLVLITGTSQSRQHGGLSRQNVIDRSIWDLTIPVPGSNKALSIIVNLRGVLVLSTVCGGVSAVDRNRRGLFSLGYDRLPIQPVAPSSPNYIPGPEDPQTLPVPQDEDEREPMFVHAHDPDYVPEPIYPEYIPLKDEHEFPAEEQPLPPVDSPTAESPGYVTESDPEEDPEEYEDDETEDSPVYYPMNEGVDGDDDDGDSSRDEANDEDEDDEDEEEEEEEEEDEHLAPADSAIVVPVDEPTSISLPPEAEVERLLAMTTPSPSPPISLSPPSAGERLVRSMAPPAHLSPLPMPSPLLPSSGCPTQIQTLRIASTQALIDAVTAALPSPSLPPLPPSLYIPPPVDRFPDMRGLEMLGTETVWMVEEEAYASREAWAHSIGLSQATHQELQTHRDHVYAHETHLQAHQTQLQLQSTLIQTQHQVHETRFQMQQAELAALRETDRRRQAQMAELLALRGQQRRARQPGPEARIPDHQDAFGDADSHI
ncbi:hypothetical protein Tco_0727249 [Tanacetum coccineum]|uniref:Uncharacterized protein n=1 Tax=Tanacetum coccineum TaxID=301880 RepID=A0ABQ4YHW8_9ASTR